MISRIKQEPAWPPRIQIAGVSSLDEAAFCAEVGVDAVGFTLGLPGGIHDGLTSEKAASIVGKLRAKINKVVITYLNSAMEVSPLIDAVKPDAVQFHGGISNQQLLILRKRYAFLKMIGRLTVIDTNSLSQITAFNTQLWDCVILDSIDPMTGRIGATGIPHDWSVSSKIVKISRLPIILAGGLTPKNVAAAITKVKPAGVDTHTGVEDEHGNRDFTKIAEFAKAASDAFEANQKLDFQGET